MNLDAIIAWAWENKEIIGLFAVIATAIGALYQPTRDLLSFLRRAAWAIIQFSPPALILRLPPLTMLFLIPSR